jgi:hypothetical protein
VCNLRAFFGIFSKIRRLCSAKIVENVVLVTSYVMRLYGRTKQLFLKTYSTVMLSDFICQYVNQ